MADKRLLLIDGNSVTFKAFYALYTSLGRFTNSEGLHTNAIYGFNTMLETMLKNVDPTHVLVAFDAGKVTFRPIVDQVVNLLFNRCIPVDGC